MGEQRTALSLSLVLFFTISALPLVSASDDSWTTLEPMPTARNNFGVAVVDGKIYAIGGSNGSYLGTNEMYDTATDTWTTKTSMPTPRYNFAIAVYQNKIFVMGGIAGAFDITQVNEVYDTITDTWETKRRVPGFRSSLCANVVNDEIYLIGGEHQYFPPRVAAETLVYHISNDSWTIKTKMPTPVASYASALIEDKIYVISGHLDSGSDCNLIQIYEPATDTWSYATPFSTAGYRASAGATSGVLAPKRIHLFKENIHYVYNPENDSWTQESPMLTPRSGPGIAVVNDEIYAIGGYYGENYRNENEKYTPADYIPEFPSWIFLPLFFVATLVGVAVRRKVFRPT